MSPSPLELSSIGLEYERPMFNRNTTWRPCIVVDIQPQSEQPVMKAPPPITIVLITSFDGKPLNEVMAEEEFKRIMSIHPSLVYPKTAGAIETMPAWDSKENEKGKIPSYVLCIPIKVYPQNLTDIDADLKLDDRNLQKLQLHLFSLGVITANADFEDLEDDDTDSDDDIVGVSPGHYNRIVTWDEIVF